MSIISVQNLGEKAVQKALRLGASDAEAFFNRNKELTIEVSEQQVETMKLADQQGVGIRLFKDGKMGFAYTSDLSDTAIDQVVTQALANSENTAYDQYNILPGAVSQYPELFLYDDEINNISVDTKIELAKEIERLARKHDQRIKVTERCAYVDSIYEVSICNSLGIQGAYQGAYCGAYAFLVAEEKGESQTGFGFQYKLKYQDIDPNFVATEGAVKAVRMLGAKTIHTQNTTVVFDPYVATNFLGLLSSGLSAESVQKGKSLMAGKINQKVSSGLISIIDDGSMDGAIMSAPFDGEGVPTQRNVLIEKGLLKGYLHNTYTAKKEGINSTGNGSRGSYKGTPEVGTTNFYIEKGNVEKEEMLRQIDKGLYITEVMGMHTANPISGDFSVGAAGLLIENGEFTKPVRGIAIAGNILELMGAIDGVASDLTFFVGKGSPTLRVSSMTVSGS